MINLIKIEQSDGFSYQKSYVSYNFISSAFKFALIPISHELYSVCQLIPQKNITNDYCILNHSVIQYSSKHNLQKIIRKTALNVEIKKNDIHIISAIVEAKFIEVSVIFKRSSDVAKWKSSDQLRHILNNILSLYVVVTSCLINVPTSKINLTDIVYICIHNTQSKKLGFRVTHNTNVIVKEIMSLNKFEQLYVNNEQFEVIGLNKQIHFLNVIYNAHLHWKSSEIPKGTKFIQKILIIGPSGCGKTRLVKHFAEKKKCGLVIIEGSYLTHVIPEESESILRSLFDEAYQRSKERTDDICIVLLDQLNDICRKSQFIASHLKRLSYQLFHILETLSEYPKLIVVATTNTVHDLHPEIRRSTKFEIEMHVGMPTEKERFKILQFHSRNDKINSSLCKKVAMCTMGYVGAELALLVREVNRIRCKNPNLYKLDSELLQLFKECITKQSASSLRGGLGVNRFGNIQMNNLGGLKDVKLCLKSFVEWPLHYPKSFKRLGIPIPKGILLYGPPGCAKTSLACAVANAMNTNFLSISAAELYSPYVGEAERNVIELFRKARVNSPCIIFIDEIDTLVGNRNVSSKSVQSKIISTFLIEMDGIGNKLDMLRINKVISTSKEKNQISENSLNHVILIAASNRPDKLDSALLRPGRFDKLIFVGPPDLNDRLDILQMIINKRKMPMADCVDLLEIAKITDRFTGADLTNLMKKAGYIALFENITAVWVKQKHILHALEDMKTSLPNKKINFY